jgi:Uma2 family endonuclease
LNQASSAKIASHSAEADLEDAAYENVQFRRHGGTTVEGGSFPEEAVTAAFPIPLLGRLPHYPFRGLLEPVSHRMIGRESLAASNWLAYIARDHSAEKGRIMNTAVLEQPASAATIVSVGDDELYEIIDGQRVRTPPMGVFAVWTASLLARFLGNFAYEKLGRAITEALFHLPAPINRDRRPDVALVLYERWAKDRPMPATDNAWNVVPNLATEVVSPTDSVEELEQKIAEYFRAGVQLVWVVHPTRNKIHVYQSPTQITVLSKNDMLDGGMVVPGFQLSLADLFTAATETPVVTNGSGPAH